MIHGIVTMEVHGPWATGAVHQASKTDEEPFTVSMADGLLRSTRQYSRWRTIRQENPPAARKIADLILERHGYVEGTAPDTAEGRRRFDLLTERIASEGIHLYKSHQFKDPIFSGAVADVDPGRGRLEGGDDGAASVNTVAVGAVSGGIRPVRENCYEFLAGVLERNGISYYGDDGVAGALIREARDEGKRLNAYFTGEGITSLLSSNAVTVRVDGTTSTRFEDVWAGLESALAPGAIMSYSSRTFGHTGVVNRVNDTWTYVNSSGRAGNRDTYRVVEEDLKQEVRGWIRRAQKMNTSLEITVGTVDGTRAREFSGGSSSAPALVGRDIRLRA